MIEWIVGGIVAVSGIGLVAAARLHQAKLKRIYLQKHIIAAADIDRLVDQGMVPGNMAPVLKELGGEVAYIDLLQDIARLEPTRVLSAALRREEPFADVHAQWDHLAEALGPLDLAIPDIRPTTLPECPPELLVSLGLSFDVQNVRIRWRPGGESDAGQLGAWPEVEPILAKEGFRNGAWHEYAIAIPGIDRPGIKGVEQLEPQLDEEEEGGLLQSVPLIAISYSAVRNIRRLISQDLDASSALSQIALDTGGYGVGSFLGTSIGAKLGALAAPWTAGMSVPVLTILGGMLGSISGRVTGRRLKERQAKQAEEDLEQALARLGFAVRDQLGAVELRWMIPMIRVALLERMCATLAEPQSVRERLFPRPEQFAGGLLQNIFRREGRVVAEILEQQYRQLRVAMAEENWAAVGKLVCFNRYLAAPEMADEIAAIDAALAHYVEEKGKLTG
jgi:hypothetical protein